MSDVFSGAGRQNNILSGAGRWSEVLLNADMLTEIACCDKPLTLDFLIKIVIRLEHVLHSCHSFQGATVPPEPMQLGHMKLSERHREKCRCKHRCFYCGNVNHLIGLCPRCRRSIAKPVLSSLLHFRSH